MGCVCGPSEKQEEHKEFKKTKPQTSMKGKGVQIGGNDNQQQDVNQNDLIAQAAEKRLQNQQNRGLTQNSQFEYELRKKKLEEAEKYENERRGENYNLRWN